jgi:hypothetical protein
VPGAARRPAVTAARLLLATGLIVSAVMVSAIGGWWGWAIGAAQLALGVAIVARPAPPAPAAAAVLVLIPAPVAATRHWTAHLPGGCRCAALAHPPPGLVSLTGVAVALDVALLALSLWLTATNLKAQVGKSSP